jgi:hypothetical protein
MGIGMAAPEKLYRLVGQPPKSYNKPQHRILIAALSTPRTETQIFDAAAEAGYRTSRKYTLEQSVRWHLQRWVRTGLVEIRL